MSKNDVVIMGLGYIGLPTAALLASKKVNVTGVDINPDIVKCVNNGEVHIVEPELDIAVSKAVKNGFLKASTKVKTANTYITVVPTPFKNNKEPDISYVINATEQIIPLLKEGDLYILESTSPVGTTEKMMELIYLKRPELKNKIFIAYCPERVLPGNVMYELIHNDRVVGGVDDKSSEKAVLFYSKYVKGQIHSTNSRTAEMCKLVENSSRDVQIAFANELSMICDQADINIWELISLANKHPRVNILNPGSGVGGHCIAVDPYFIVSEFPKFSKIISTAREINNHKSIWCLKKIKNEKLRFEKNFGRKPKIALMGLSFKPNIDDLRESPAQNIVQSLVKDYQHEVYYIVEPNIISHELYELSNYNDAYDNSDIVVFLVAHNEFKNLHYNSQKIILDFCGINNLK